MIFVGIITFHHVANFGAFLQAWALAQTVQRLGCRVEVLDYRPSDAEPGRRQGLRALVPSLGRWRMRRFMSANLPLSRTFDSRQGVSEYVARRGFDCLICGSDQIWLKDDRRSFDSTYYLDVTCGLPIRRIAYAPSCGNMDGYGRHTEDVRLLLNGFHAVSARDQRTIRILSSCGVQCVAHVVDPTLLADFEPLAKRVSEAGAYVAVTGPLDAAACRFAREVGDLLGLPLIAVGTRCATADRQKRFVNAGEWLSYVGNASYVITTLFHGAACSIRLRRPFAALDAGGRGFKLSELLDRFGLGARFLRRKPGESYPCTADILSLDYGPVEERLAAETEASMEFLRAALFGDKRATPVAD